MKILMNVVIAVMATASLGQTGPNESGRTTAIWNAVYDRITDQADAWFQDGDYPAAVQVLKVQAELFPNDYDVWTNLGWMQENIEQWDEALATYIRYRELNPSDPDAGLPEAFYFVRKQMYAKVPPILEPAIKKPCHPNNFRLLALSYERQKMYSDSARVWKTYIARVPNDGQAKRNLSRVERELSQHG